MSNDIATRRDAKLTVEQRYINYRIVQLAREDSGKYITTLKTAIEYFTLIRDCEFREDPDAFIYYLTVRVPRCGCAACGLKLVDKIVAHVDSNTLNT